MKRYLLPAVAMVLLTATVPLLWHGYINLEEPEEVDTEMDIILTTLNRKQLLAESQHRRDMTNAETLVSLLYPWIQQNNTQKNYFLHASDESVYSDGVMVFLHHHRSAGSAMHACLEDLGRRHKYALTPAMDSSSRTAWHRQDHRHDNVSKYKIHRGQYSFGMCDGVRRNCSYMTILRDPLERAISSYQHCLKSPADEMCSVIDARKLTLRQWILHQGSLLFQQLLFHPEQCEQPAELDAFHSVYRRDIPESLPCWFKHKLLMDRLSADHYHELTEYVISRLDQWFAVIGSYSDLQATLHMLELTYKLPFTQCQNLHEIQSHTDNQSGNLQKQRLPVYEFDDEDDSSLEYLMYDHEVKKALQADYKIYNAAMQIYRQQRQVVSNKL